MTLSWPARIAMVLMSAALSMEAGRRAESRPFGPAPLRNGFILAAANAAGSHGTYWRTDVWLHNAGASTATVSLYFLPAGRAGDPTPQGEIRVEPSETIQIRNILGTLLRVPDLVGAIEYRVVDGPEVFVQYQTFSADAESTPVEAVSLARSATAGNPLHITALVRNTLFRTNLSIVNPLPRPVEATVETFDDDGKSVGRIRVELEPRSYLALNDHLSPLGRTRRARVVVRPSEEGRLFALGSVISAESGAVTIRSASHEFEADGTTEP